MSKYFLTEGMTFYCAQEMNIGHPNFDHGQNPPSHNQTTAHFTASTSPPKPTTFEIECDIFEHILRGTEEKGRDWMACPNGMTQAPGALDSFSWQFDRHAAYLPLTARLQ